ncbi:MAG TPA: zinc ribbon domain-containing protein [Candidatus Binatia bacterium]|nr:zinc ribbon domain-containing protein [Candidatus Binatia bacterium]
MISSNRGVWPAWLWMFILSLLLGWLPLIGPAIAGFVGGLQAGAVGAALIAAIIPSLLVAAFIFLLSTVLALPILGVLAGMGIFVILLVGTLPLLAGAWIGGVVAERRQTDGERRPAIAEQPRCPSCGERVADTDTVCPNCGATLVGG